MNNNITRLCHDASGTAIEKAIPVEHRRPVVTLRWPDNGAARNMYKRSFCAEHRELASGSRLISAVVLSLVMF